jgi:hypothetical protein
MFPNTTSSSISVIETEWSLSETIAFQEGSDRWISKYSFLPERYGYVNSEMFSFLNGELWKHNASNTFNNFHGTQYTSQVNPVFNKGPHDQKKLYLFCLRKGIRFGLPILSLLRKDKKHLFYQDTLRKIQNVWFADIKQDINTPNMPSTDEALFNGDFMQSNTLNVMLENQASDQAKLKFVSVFSNTINKGFAG